MTSVLLHTAGSRAQALQEDLEAVGFQVLGCVAGRSELVHAVIGQSPDVLVCDDPLPDAEFFHALQTVGDTAPRPVIVFTSDMDAGKIARSAEVGIHAYVVSGYAPHRLRALVHLAQARFAREQALRAQLAEVARRFEERKMVDRAKGILMRARQVSDDEAFGILRAASMHSNQRIGQVSQLIIHSARFAEDVNRAGQLRMLSQRLVKLALLQVAGAGATPVAGRLKDSILRVDANLAELGKNLSQPTFGDLLGQVLHAWVRLKQALQGELSLRTMVHLDALAERLLQEAERLTLSLENAGSAPPLQVLNLAGRQRMLSQRFTKYALLQALGDKTAVPRTQAGMAESRAAFEEALRQLHAMPLSSAEIRRTLDAAGLGWDHLLAGVEPAGQGAGRVQFESVAVASEELLEIFEQLSGHYERSMQMLVG